MADLRTERLRELASAQEQRIEAFEVRLLEAVGKAMRLWLQEVSRQVLGTSASVQAAGAFDAEGFDAASYIWNLALRDLLKPLVSDLFGEAFLAVVRGNPVAAQPFRLHVIQEVESRLKIFPAEQFEEVRMEIAEAISEGEDINQIRDRIGAFLDFDTTAGAQGQQAETRRLEGRITVLEKALEDPDSGLDSEEIRELRRERGQLYEALYKARGGWQWKARRIARTEAALALNAGTFYAALSNAEAADEQMWKCWISTADERTRPTHVFCDGQVRKLDDPFAVGGFPLLYPADPEGPGHETINCRCSLLIFDAVDLEDEGIDPDDLPESNPTPNHPADDDLPDLDDPVDDELATFFASAQPTHDHEGASMPDEPQQLPDGWRGVLAPIGVRSGDNRMIADPGGAPRLRQPPRTLLHQKALGMGHEGAVAVGRIDRVWVEGNLMMGEGPFDLQAEGASEAARQLAEGFVNGVSIDLDDMIMEERWFSKDGKEMPLDDDTDWEAMLDAGATPVYVATSWRLMGATLVSQPAFDEARIQPLYGYTPHDDADLLPTNGPRESTDEAGDPGLVASVVANFDLPIGDRDAEWDAAGALERVFAYATDADGNVDPAIAEQAFLWRDPDSDATTAAAYSLPIADVVNDALTMIPAAVQAVADAVPGVEASDEDRAALEGATCGLFDKVRGFYDDWPACPFEEADEAEEAVDEAPADEGDMGLRVLVAAGGGMSGRALPASAFADPQLTGPTPLTITDSGEIYGHLAIWGTCHIGYADVCVTPPRSETNYALFHLGEVITDAGPVPVGKITMSTGHADPRAAVRPATDHYDNTGTVAAAIHAGEDQFGIWVAGILVEEVTPAQIEKLRMSPLSGDWRRVNNNLELVAALAVNTPGFPVVRTVAASGAAGQQLSLVAAGIVPQPRPKPGDAPPAPAQFVDLGTLAKLVVREQHAHARRESQAERTARRIGRDRASRLQAATARVRGDAGE